MSTAFGMMDGTYFVPRGELLAWLNDLLELDYTKVEQVCNGAALCQLFDAIYPGTVPVNKLNFDSKLEYKWIDNFKVLQLAFKKNNIDKDVDVAKLIKGKYQDNLEFLQWAKKFFEVNYKGEPYNAVERRKVSGVPYSADKGKSGKDFVGTPASATTSIEKTAVVADKKSATPKKTIGVVRTPTKPTPKTTSKVSVTPGGKNDESKIQELNQQLADFKVTVDTLERERDFYFGKLRDVEVLTQNFEGGESLQLIAQIQKILYATDDEGNVTVEGEEVTGEQVTTDEQDTF